MTRRSRLALIGYGTLAREFERVWGERLRESHELLGALIRHAPAGDCCPKLYGSLDELLADRPDFVLEFAGASAVAEYGEKVLAAGCDLVVVSVGALADDALRGRLAEAAKGAGSTLHVASGAVGGFDVLRTVALGGCTHFSIDNVKAPEALAGAPGLRDRELSGCQRTEAFRGSAREAILEFPKNVNVAVASALAAGALDEAEVVITSDPGKVDNTHVICAKSDLVSARVEVSSTPDAANPRSSTVTAWSVAALLADLASPIRYF